MSDLNGKLIISALDRIAHQNLLFSGQGTVPELIEGHVWEGQNEKRRLRQ